MSALSLEGRPRKKNLFSCAPSDGVKAFGPGRLPGYPPRRPRDIPPKNFMFTGCFSVPGRVPAREGVLARGVLGRESGPLASPEKDHCGTPGQIQGSKTPSPETPRENNSKITPRAPTPNSKKKLKKKQQQQQQQQQQQNF